LHIEDTDSGPNALLAGRPNITVITARYDEMQQLIRDGLDAALGPFTWRQNRDGDTATCGREFNGTGAEQVYMKPWGFAGSIPDEDWPRAKQIFTTIAAEYGFTIPGADPDQGAVYDFGSQVNTNVQITTGCHLPAGSGAP
jgi:hypothetical protein